jgi:purine-binding chemotaxis protein CheW
MNIASSDIDDAPSFGTDVETDYLLGVAKCEGRVKLLLDIDKVLSARHIADLPTLSADYHQQTP